jgi:hypothetical protein
MLQRHESANLEVLNVGHLAEYLAACDLFTSSPVPTDDYTGKRCPDVGAPQQVVDLADAHFGDVRVTERKIAIGLGLLELELGYEIRTTQFALPPQLALELPNIYLCTFEQRFLFGSLQQQSTLVDARDGCTLLNDSARLGDHEQLSGDTGRNLYLVAAVDGARDSDSWGDFGSRHSRNLHDPGRRLLGERHRGRQRERDDNN